MAISILIIDGDSASRNYLAAALEKNGYTTLPVSLGREGLISAWKDMPDIIILDPNLPDIPGVEVLSRLRQDRRTSNVPCVALSDRENPKEMKELLSGGCNEYLAKSSQTMQRLLELIPRLIVGETTPLKKRGIFVAFLSGKGGMGTSSLCANIAMCLGREKAEARVAVVDLVLPIGSIANIVGYNDPMNVVSVARQDPYKNTAVYFKENLPSVPNWYFKLLAGSPDPESANQLAVDRLDGIINAILASYDYIFVDLGRTLSRISLPIIQAADVIVLVVGADVSTTILTQTLLEYFKNQGINPKHIYPLQNRAIGLEGLTKAELEQMTGLQIALTMPYMSGNFTLANNRHEPVILKFPNDSSAFTLKQAADQIAELGQKNHG